MKALRLANTNDSRGAADAANTMVSKAGARPTEKKYVRRVFGAPDICQAMGIRSGAAIISGQLQRMTGSVSDARFGVCMVG